MEQDTLIPPSGADDVEGARRLFQDFFAEYQPVFMKIEMYLSTLIKETPEFAEGYVIWRKSLQNISRGVYLTMKKIPLPNTDDFLEALKMFTFEGAIRFLADICKSCKITLEREWDKRFREHIDMLLFSFVILQRQMQPAMVPVR